MSYLPTHPPEMRLDLGDTPKPLPTGRQARQKGNPPPSSADRSALPLRSVDGIRAIAFDCYGTLVDFTDKGFIGAYDEVCRQQNLACDGKALWDKWMEIWRRQAAEGKARENPRDWSLKNGPRPLSGPVLAFRPYREEWPEHFEMCFRELGAQGDPIAAYDHLRNRLAGAVAFEETAPVLAALKPRFRLGILSNADDDFLTACLQKNGLEFEVIVTSEGAGFYKPHEDIFRSFAEAVGAAMDEVLYVGDSQYADVLGAKNAGMPVAWLNRDGASLREGMPPPDYEIASLNDLSSLLL